MTSRPLRWRVISALTLGGALVSLAIACGDDGDPAATPTPADAATGDTSTTDTTTTTDAPSSGDPQVDAFCAATLGLYAPEYEECCDQAVAPSKYKFEDTLLKGLGFACTEQLGKSVRSGRATFVPAEAATCTTNVVAQIEARTCPQVLHGPTNESAKTIFKDAAGCSGVLVGRQQADAPCANDHDCIDGLTCVGWSNGGDGVCKPPPGEGAPCAFAIVDGAGFIELFQWGFGTHPRCAPGLYCAVTALQGGTCRATKPATGACDSHDECAEGLRCQNGSCGTAGPAPAGGPCERKSDCQDGLYCKAVDGGRTCAPREIAGANCSGSFSSDCEGACIKPDGGGQETCVAYCGSR